LTKTVLHWFDHQTKSSILVLYYFCKSLYRSACIAVTVFFICIKTATPIRELLGCNSWYSGTVLVVRLLWGAVRGGSGLYNGFCITMTCCGVQQGSSWNTQWVSVWFLVLLWVQQWSITGCSETFLGYTVDSA